MADHDSSSPPLEQQTYEPHLGNSLLIYDEDDQRLLNELCGDQTFIFPDNNQAEKQSSSVEESGETEVIALSFDSYEAYRQYIEQQRLEEYENALADLKVDDAPMRAAEKQQCIRRIIAAFKNTRNIIDKEGKRGNMPLAAQRIKDDYYTALDFEKAAWELFENARLAQAGVRLILPRLGSKPEKYSSFDARMEAILHSLTLSKAMCKQALDPLYIDRICEQPASELRSKIVNFKINGTRDVQNDIGRAGINGKLDVTSLSSYKEQAQKRLEALVEKSKVVAELGSGSNAAPTRGTKRKIDSSSPDLDADSESVKEQDAAEIRRYRPLCSPGRPARRLRMSAGQNSNELRLIEQQPPPGPTTSTDSQPVLSNDPLSLGRGDATAYHFNNLGTINSSLFTNHTPPQRQPQIPRRSFPSAPISFTSPSPTFVPSTALPLQPQRPLASSSYTQRLHLCTLLSIPSSFAHNTTLPTLRLYARAYNASLAHSSWYSPSPSHSGYIGRFASVTSPTGRVFEHFAQAFPEMREIALERRDVLPGGEINRVGRLRGGFRVDIANLELHHALGVRVDGGLVFDEVFVDHRAGASGARLSLGSRSGSGSS